MAAIIHHPLISSGRNGDNPQVRETTFTPAITALVWRVLEHAGADLVVSGHDHLYERHARVDFEGRPAQRGLRLFIVGTGGATLYQSRAMRPTTEAKAASWTPASTSVSRPASARRPRGVQGGTT